MSSSSTQGQKTKAGGYPMADDKVIGDAGNLTVYERPDGSKYALDRKGHGAEWDEGEPIFGRARFDSRASSTGRWPGSRSAVQTVEVEPARARLHRRPQGR